MLLLYGAKITKKFYHSKKYCIFAKNFITYHNEKASITTRLDVRHSGCIGTREEVLGLWSGLLQSGEPL
jgi:hypothetical protein